MRKTLRIIKISLRSTKPLLLTLILLIILLVTGVIPASAITSSPKLAEMAPVSFNNSLLPPTPCPTCSGETNPDVYSTGDSDATVPEPETDFVPGQVLIKFKKVSTDSGNLYLAASPTDTLSRLSGDYGITSMEPAFPIKASSSNTGLLYASAPSDSDPGLERWYTATLDESADIPGVVEALKQDAAVETAEPNYIRRIADHPNASTDPRYSEQWYLNTINALEAWQFLADNGINPGGSHDVVVAVIDTGVDYTHPDLAANIWVNSAEFNGSPGVDDDGNGFVDDIHGANVVSNQHSGDPADDHGHGTHVAGIIGMQAYNKAGGVGVAYNTQIMPIKAAQYSGVLSTTDIAEAVYYAVDKGADVINMSFGGYGKSHIEEDALIVASNQAVLVAAAGNDGKVNLPCPCGVDMYPAAYNWVLGVMASEQSGSRASFSNWDCTPHDIHEYELMAPGVDILSTLPGGQYAAWDGTSMATPVVSGIAALVRSYHPDKVLYPSRFIMGQIASQGANAYTALTQTPQPELSYLEHWLFDTTIQSMDNDNDGIVDAGETMDLAITIRNHWGKADNVEVNLRAWNGISETDDPYITFETDMDTVSYGAIGSFNYDDNGLIYDGDVITGVNYPFRFTVSSDCPNDHIIPFYLTMTCINGYDANDPNSPYIFTGRFEITVQKGRELPRIISEDMILTKDEYWIITGQTLIEAGVTVTVTEGTQIQFGAPTANDPHGENILPYLQVEGTLRVVGTFEEPVELFGCKAFYYPNVQIRNFGTTELFYTKVVNPILGRGYSSGSLPYSPLTLIDHLDATTDREMKGFDHFNMDVWSISSLKITNSIIHTMLGGMNRFPYLALNGPMLIDNVLIEGLIPTSILSSNEYNMYIGDSFQGVGNNILNSVFFQDNINNKRIAWWLMSGAKDFIYENNAFLSKVWDPNSNNWMSFTPYDSTRTDIFNLDNNFWGTTQDSIIDQMIHDSNDDFNIGHIEYHPILSIPAETTYPFVWDVAVSQSGVNTNRVGMGEATFTVTFNRDMDMTIQPQVSFGPDIPYSDFSITGAWVDARTWAGAFNITPTTGDGYQLIRVAGPARAASDPWLVIGNDSGRFRFEVITSGTEAMNLQATGSEGKIDLSWTQDDFDMLAGYNLYRSDTTDGTYTRINTTIIPPDQKTYTDTDVQPGQTYYYKFTVVKTDLTESDFSNMAAAAPLDTIPPVINHTPLSSASPGLSLQIHADVTDNVAVSSVKLYHQTAGGTTYQMREMVKTTGNRYSTTLEGALVTAPGIDYYIEATDGISIVRSGRADLPYTVTVTDNPEVIGITPNKGSSDGGTAVTITGSNFKTGASVTFGGAVASQVNVVSANQITCITPAHFPGVVDLAVINADEANGILLRAFTYESDEALVSLPDASGDTNAIIEIPIAADNIKGLLAIDITVQFDSNVLTARGARTGSFTPGFSLETNISTPGQISISLASATSVTGSGTLAYLEFLVNGAASAATDLTLSAVSLNDGAIPVLLDHGTFAVGDLISVSGNVLYFQDSRAVLGAALALAGNRSYNTTTDNSGYYSIGNVATGNYTLTPSKSDETTAITSYDASLILRASAGTLTLSSQQQKAADVDRSGNITSMDAAYVLQKSAQLIGMPFPGAGKVWDFEPVNRTYQPLDADLTSQNFTAILIGDVSGNWGAGGLGSGIQSDSTADIRLGEAVTVPGRQLTVSVELDMEQSALFGADIVLSYNSDLVSPLSVSKSDLAQNFSMAVNLNQSGQIRIAMAGASPIVSDGVLLTAVFDVAGPAGITSPLEITEASFNEGAIQTTLYGTDLKIVPFGDANKDMLVDAADITGVERMIAGLDAPTPGADANGDGLVNALDITKAERIFAKLD